MRRYTTRPKLGKWRSSRGSSRPWRSVMVHPQRRQVVVVSVLSTVRMSSPSLVSSVWRTRKSGISSGIEISGCLGIRYHPSDQVRILAYSASSCSAVQTLHLVTSTASLGEPHYLVRFNLCNRLLKYYELPPNNALQPTASRQDRGDFSTRFHLQGC